MRSTLKLLCALLALALILPMNFISCSKNNEKDSSQEKLVICENQSSDYVFVRADKANSSVVKAIFAAKDAIKERLGVDLAVNSDWVRPGQEIPSDAKEILIGETNREESKDAMSKLEKTGFLIKVYGERIVIVATDELLLIDAINYFVNTYVNGAKGDLFVSRDLTYLSAASDYEPITDNGDGTLTLKLKSFVIVYDNSNKQKFVPAAAKAFGKRVNNAYNTLGATEDETQNNYEILFGECKREDFKTTDSKILFRDFYLGYSNNKLSISASSIYGYESAINFLFDGFGESGITISKDGEYKEYDYGTSAYAGIFKNYDNPAADGAWMVNVSHRGDYISNKNPENSIAAYQSCINNFIDVIETDLHKTKDGKWIICHDASINRTTNGTGEIEKLTLATIQGYYLKVGQGGSSAAISTHKMPTLTDIIKLEKNKCLYNLDKLSPEDFQEVYDIFEKEDAVDCAMFKTSAMTADDLINWFADLLEDGRKLPAFCPLLYSNTETKAETFKGLITMIETGNDLSKSTLALLQNEYKIRAMCLTALDSTKENFEYYTKLMEAGYGAIMTDRTILLKEFIDKHYD